ncbi:ethylbenzene dehydrogenase-related protein [Thioalkalivibrio thiocyanoxidans]|uniref:ethylbenzene dehydrogenase-related protein n=1 Tax=Thioalkalivibrio thiocyanoxidans TaxID=152475 RepID=UPI00037704F5|nr:ethylbenzene dehydrogenase-related protein [Thioalkalivibrio thiocyanoxidans]
MKKTLMALAVAAAFPALALAEPRLVDTDRNVFIPAEEDARAVLRVAAVYNDEDFRIHYEYETDTPSWYHQVWRYEDGEWVRYGSGGPGPDEHGLYEDRISMMLDDGKVEGFDRMGGWMTAHDGMRSLTSEVDADAVREHPKLGGELGRSDVRKYLPQTRVTDDPEETSWDQILDDDAVDQLQSDGVFLDLWQWRSHRSHPMGYADNNYVLHYRLSSEGTSMFTTNWDDDADQPAWMFDPEKVGAPALEWGALIAREYGQDDAYYIHEGNAVAFDPDHDWQEGDVIPQRFLQEPSGARGAIRAEGGYEDGAWRIALTRSLEAPNARDSKTLEHGESYNVAFAVHSAAGARWHLVSLPMTLGLEDEEADIVARRVDGDLDDADLEWTEVEVFYPGQITYQFLHSDDHPGRELVLEGEQGVRDQHDLDTLPGFIVDMEQQLLRDAD